MILKKKKNCTSRTQAAYEAFNILEIPRREWSPTIANSESMSGHSAPLSVRVAQRDPLIPDREGD